MLKGDAKIVTIRAKKLNDIISSLNGKLDE